MKLPIILVDMGEVSLYADLASLIDDIEVIEVVDGQFEYFDSDGFVLTATSDPACSPIKVEKSSDAEQRPEVLRSILLEWAQNIPEISYAHLGTEIGLLSLAELVMLASDYELGDYNRLQRSALSKALSEVITRTLTLVGKGEARNAQPWCNLVSIFGTRKTNKLTKDDVLGPVLNALEMYVSSAKRNKDCFVNGSTMETTQKLLVRSGLELAEDGNEIPKEIDSVSKIV